MLLPNCLIVLAACLPRKGSRGWLINWKVELLMWLPSIRFNWSSDRKVNTTATSECQAKKKKKQQLENRKMGKCDWLCQGGRTAKRHTWRHFAFPCCCCCCCCSCSAITSWWQLTCHSCLCLPPLLLLWFLLAHRHKTARPKPSRKYA